ncbi:hypothetical protein TcWFU_008905 [Taenia crassiceps]|uniref:Uncharacterized protein n=1 Tax=Taenia crassiceps TaxID=6207 RepID=A0ABR4QCM8_9CEST
MKFAWSSDTCPLFDSFNFGANSCVKESKFPKRRIYVQVGEAFGFADAEVGVWNDLQRPQMSSLPASSLTCPPHFKCEAFELMAHVPYSACVWSIPGLSRSEAPKAIRELILLWHHGDMRARGAGLHALAATLPPLTPFLQINHIVGASSHSSTPSPQLFVFREVPSMVAPPMPPLLTVGLASTKDLPPAWCRKHHRNGKRLSFKSSQPLRPLQTHRGLDETREYGFLNCASSPSSGVVTALPKHSLLNASVALLRLALQHEEKQAAWMLVSESTLLQYSSFFLGVAKDTTSVLWWLHWVIFAREWGCGDFWVRLEQTTEDLEIFTAPDVEREGGRDTLPGHGPWFSCGALAFPLHHRPRSDRGLIIKAVLIRSLFEVADNPGSADGSTEKCFLSVWVKAFTLQRNYLWSSLVGTKWVTPKEGLHPPALRHPSPRCWWLQTAQLWSCSVSPFGPSKSLYSHASAASSLFSTLTVVETSSATYAAPNVGPLAVYETCPLTQRLFTSHDPQLHGNSFVNLQTIHSSPILHQYSAHHSDACSGDCGDFTNQHPDSYGRGQPSLLNLKPTSRTDKELDERAPYQSQVETGLMRGIISKNYSRMGSGMHLGPIEREKERGRKRDRETCYLALVFSIASLTPLPV